MTLVDLARDTRRSWSSVADAGVRSSAPRSLFGYEVIGQLGKGAGSVVHEVRDPRTRHRFAMKHVVVGEQRHLRYIEQLEREHEVGQAVRHEGLRLSLALYIKRNLLRRITEAGLVMELVEGWPISVPTAPAEQALGYLVQVSRSLEAFHRAGFVHCDLKPQNLLLDRHLHVKLIDLGQACRIGTVKERVQGTPDFISPEQVKCLSVTPRTDVYNFGATAYCILTGGKIPTLFTVKGGQNSFLIDDRVTPPHEVDTKVPALLSGLVMNCVALSPEQRPGMSDVTRRLEAIQYTLSRSAQRVVRRSAVRVAP